MARLRNALGTVVNVSDDTAARLRMRGYEDAGDGPASSSSLDGMTKDELFAEADRRGVEVKKSATKAELLEALGG